MDNQRFEEIVNKVKKSSMRKRRIYLMLSLVVALFSVVTASMTTFAWYQAQAATITTTGDSVDISVAAPDDYEIDAKLYTYVGNVTSHTWSGTFATDFVTSGNANYSTSLTSFAPGQKKYYCIALSCDINMTSVYLKIASNSNLTLTNKANRKIISGDAGSETTTGNTINIASAMKIHTKYSDTNDFDCIRGTYGNDNAFTYGSAPYTLISQASGVGQTAYLYYCIEFDNSVVYQEYESYIENAVTKYRVLYTTPTEKAQNPDDRFFKAGSGNSTCFEGLTFGINQFTVSVTA